MERAKTEDLKEVRGRASNGFASPNEYDKLEGWNSASREWIVHDFFISYALADCNWAEWIAWHLEEAGYSTILQAWDFRPGANSILEKDRAASQADRTLIVLSPDYLGSRATAAEWAAAAWADPGGEQGKVLPVRIRTCDPHGLIGPLVYVDLVGLEEAAAWEALRAGVLRGRVKPAVAPRFPAPVRSAGGEPPPYPVLPQDLAGIRSAYLDWLRRVHGTLRGVSLNGQRAPEVELKDAYVALRADAIGLAERLESRRQLMDFQMQRAEDADVDHLLAERHSYPIAHQERTLPKSFIEDDSGALALGEICRRHRALVVLGDPGSGKTTLVRWLALCNAAALGPESGAVTVPAHQVDLSAPAGEDGIRLGPARLPILLRISEFAEALENHFQGGIAGFFGHDLSFGRPTYPRGHARHGEEIDGADLQRLFRWYLQNNRALLLLDGLDEITAGGGRARVTEAVERLVDDFVAAMPVDGEPWQAGGNQILVTSRIAGYHAEPLKRQLPHFVIEPLSEAAIRYFCRTWTMALHKSLASGGERTADWLDRVDRDAEALAGEILSAERPGLRELATNPLLVSVLATVFLANDRRLPEWRVELYETTVDDNLVEVWRRRDPQMNVKAMLELLCALAAHLHDTTSTGLLTRRALWHWLEVNVADSELAWSALCQDIGLLVERGSGLYGFLHLTFEEYLAGRYLVRDRTRAAEEIAARLRDPRWREPVLLALGHAGLHWRPQEYHDLLDRLVEADEAEDQVPAAALLLTEALGEIPEVPRALVCKIVRRLLDAAAQDGLAALRRQAEESIGTLLRIRGGRFSPLVEDAFCAALESPGAGTGQAAAASEAAARVLRDRQFFSDRLGQALLAALARGAGGVEAYKALEDLACWNRTLQLTGRRDARQTADGLEARLSADLLAPLAEVRILASPERGQQGPRPVSLRSEELSLRRVLLGEPELAELVAGDPDWLRLVVALGGGLGNFRLPETRDEMVALTQMIESSAPGPEVGRRAAVRLDTHVVPRAWILARTAPRFGAEHLFFPSPLSDLVLEALRRRGAAQELQEQLRAIWRGSPLAAPAAAPGSPADALWASYLDLREGEQLGPANEPPSGGATEAASDPRRAEALVALVALGADVEAELSQGAADPKRSSARRVLQQRLECLAASLGDPLARAAESSLLDLLIPGGDVAADLWQDVAAWTCELVAAFGSTLVNPVALLTSASLPPGVKAQLLAETWSRLLAQSGSDWQYHLVVSLDAYGHLLSDPPEVLVDALVLAKRAGNRRWPRHQGWMDEDLDPLPRTRREALFEALEAIAGMPPEVPYARSWALGRLAPLLAGDHRELLPEVLALAVTLLPDPVHLSDALKDLAPDLADIDSSRRVEEILVRIRALASSYLRLRALLRLLEGTPELQHELLPEILAATGQGIPAGREQIFVLEQLLRRAPPNAERTLLDRIVAAAERIEDPQDRALILARTMLRYFSGEDRRQGLRRALEATAALPDLRRRGETLRLLSRSMIGEGEVGVEWRRQVDGLPALERARALGLAAPVLSAFEPFARLDSKERVAAWGALTLLARVRDLRRLDEWAGASLGDLWERIAEGGEDALGELTRRAATAQVSFDLPAVRGIEALLRQGKEDHAAAILAGIETPSRDFVQILRRWRTFPRLTRTIDLLLAEAGGLAVQVVPSLAHLLEEDDDRLRLRAAVALYQPAGGARRRASSLGQATLEALMRCCLDLRPTAPRVALAFRWAFETVLFDSPEMIQNWARIAEEGAARREADCAPAVAGTLLNSIQWINRPAWHRVLQELEQRGPVVQRELLVAVARLSSRQGFDEEQEFSLRKVLRRMAAEAADEGIRVRAIEALGWAGQGIADFFESLGEWIEAPPAIAAEALVALGRRIGRLGELLEEASVLDVYLKRLEASPTPTDFEEGEKSRIRSVLAASEQQRREAERLRNLLWKQLADQRWEMSVAAAEGLLRSGVTAQDLLLRAGSRSLVLEGLIGACRSRYVNNAFRLAVQDAGRFLTEQQDGRVTGQESGGGRDLFDTLVQRLDRALAGRGDWVDQEEEIYCLLPVVAAAAERMPAVFSTVAGQLGRGFAQRLQSAAMLTNSFPARAAAIVLLSLLRDLDASLVPALRATLYDVPYVRTAALRAIERLRDVRIEALDSLIAGLVDEPSPLACYALSRVLVSIARNPGLEPALRRPIREKVQRALVHALRHPGAHRHVYLLEGSADGAFRMIHLGRLGQLFHQGLLELSVLEMDRRHSRRPVAEGEGLLWLSVPTAGSTRMEIAVGDIGQPRALITHQVSWYRQNGGGVFHSDITASLNRLQEIAEDAGLGLAGLIDHAVETAHQRRETGRLKEARP